jgi:hypothetical protein
MPGPGDPEDFEYRMNHACRDFAREKFAQSIGSITSPTVKNAERSIYNWAVQETRRHGQDPSWENPQFRWRYKQKLHALTKELTRGEAVDVSLQVTGDHVNFNWKIIPQLVYRIKRKELEAKSLARYSADVLWPEGPYATTRLALRTKDMDRENSKAQDENYEGLFKCGKCKSTKTSYYQMQTRSADEPSALPLVYSYLLSTDSLSSDDLRDMQGVWEQVEVLVGILISDHSTKKCPVDASLSRSLRPSSRTQRAASFS